MKYEIKKPNKNKLKNEWDKNNTQTVLGASTAGPEKQHDFGWFEVRNFGEYYLKFEGGIWLLSSSKIGHAVHFWMIGDINKWTWPNLTSH